MVLLSISFLITHDFNPNLLMGLYGWNFQVIDLLFFGLLATIIYRYYQFYTLLIIVFTYGFSEFFSWFMEKILIYLGILTYSIQYPANSFPVNPLFISACSFFVLCFIRPKGFTTEHIGLSFCYTLYFVFFLIELQVTNSYQIWFTHPIAYFIQSVIIIPFFSIVKRNDKDVKNDNINNNSNS